MLAIVYRGIAIPILFGHCSINVAIPDTKSVLLDSTLHLHFGKDRIVNVFADREFIGEKWFTWLIEKMTLTSVYVLKTLL